MFDKMTTMRALTKLILWSCCMVPALYALNNLPILSRFSTSWRQMNRNEIEQHHNNRHLTRRSIVETLLRASNSRPVPGAGATAAAARGSQLEEKELTEDELQEVMNLALGEDHTKELSQKVEAAMQEDWDLQQGVSPGRTKPLPIKANVDMWTYYARQEFLRGNFSGATKLYQRCIDYDPCDGRSWLGMSRIYWKKGEHVSAEKSFKDGLYYSPKNPFLLQAWAVMLEKQGKSEQAMKLLTTSVKSNPRHAASWVALARIHQRAGRVDEARFCYSSAVDSDPRSYVALQAWGVLEANNGNVALARDLYRRATKASNKSVHALQAWATLEKKAGNLKEAEELLSRALKAWPDSTRIRQSFAQVYEMQSEIGKAREIFIKGEEMAAACGDAGFFQSWALFELRNRMRKPSSSNNNNDDNDNEEEEQRSDVSVSGELSFPSSSSSSMAGAATAAATTTVAAAASLIAVANTNSGRVVGGITDDTQTLVRRLFKKAVTVNKYHSASWVAWAKHEQSTGNLDVARRLLVAGISNFPHSRNIGWFHCALASLAKQDGDINTARACYDRALDSSPPQQSLPVLMEYARMETVRSVGGDPVQAKRLFELAAKRFPGEERVWSSYIDFVAGGSLTQASSSSSSSSSLSAAQMAAIKDLEERREVAMNSFKDQTERRRLSDAQTYGLTDDTDTVTTDSDDEGIDTISYPVAERFGIAEDSSDEVVFSNIGTMVGTAGGVIGGIMTGGRPQQQQSTTSTSSSSGGGGGGGSSRSIGGGGQVSKVPAVADERKRVLVAAERERVLDELLSGLEEGLVVVQQRKGGGEVNSTNKNSTDDNNDVQRKRRSHL